MNPETIELPRIGRQRRGGTQAKTEWFWSAVSRLCAIGFFWVMARCLYEAVTMFGEPLGVPIAWLVSFGIWSGCAAVAMWLRGSQLGYEHERRHWPEVVSAFAVGAVYANGAYYWAANSQPIWMVISAVFAAALALYGVRELLRR